MQYPPSTNYKTMNHNDNNTANNNNDINNNDINNLLGETDLETEVEKVKKNIETNREEHLKANTKEETNDLRIPSLQRCSTYCAPKIEDDQEDLPLPTMKKEIAYDISEESKKRLVENRSAIWRRDMTVVINPSDWVGKKAPELTTNNFGVKYIIKGRNEDAGI